MPFGDDGLAAATGTDGKVYVFGPNAAVFDPASGQWSGIAQPNTLRYWAGGASDAQGRIYAIGGSPPANSGGALLNSVERYDPARGSWSAVASMPMHAAQVGAATGCDGRIYVFGGDNGQILNTVQVYDPNSDSWTFSP